MANGASNTSGIIGKVRGICDKPAGSSTSIWKWGYRMNANGFDAKVKDFAISNTDLIYEKAGKYRILVKVIDIFGNDISQAFDVEVK